MFGQFAGMGAAIFYLSSWDVVEAWTWIVQASWMFFGAGFFVWQKTDFDEKSAFGVFEEKIRNKLVNSKQFDQGKRQFLEELITEIEDYQKVLNPVSEKKIEQEFKIEGAVYQ